MTTGRATSGGSDPLGGIVTVSGSGSILVSGERLPELNEVTAALAPVAVYTAATWLRSKHQVLDGLTPIEWLRERRDPSIVVEEARRYAHAHRLKG